MAEDEKPDLTNIPIYYERSRHYRTIRVDGVQAGITPRAAIQCMFFLETKPTPEYVVHKITPEGGLGDEIERVEKKGVIREAQINVVMDEATTIQFIELLQRLLKQLESFRQPEAKGSGVAKDPEVK
jgi:hypothetical protein